MSKILVVLILCALCASFIKGQINKEERLKEEKMHQEECMKETGATQSDVDELISKHSVTSRPAQCLGACLMKKHKVMDDNGKFIKSAALEHMKIKSDGNEAKYKISAEVIEACAGIALPSDHCAAAKALFDCSMKEGAARAKS